MICMFSNQLKYISAWSLGMISMQASGITYFVERNHKNSDGTVRYNFDRVKVTDFTKFFL